MRVSNVKNSAGVLEVKDTNDYYPFGMSFLKTAVKPVYDPMAIPYNYKFGGKELQETGQYDFGARMYMPDLGRWGVVDPLAETTRRLSPYNYALDNPVMFVDPDGRKAYEHPIPGEYNHMPSENSFMNLRGNADPRNHSAGGEGGGDHTIGGMYTGSGNNISGGINFTGASISLLLNYINAGGTVNSLFGESKPGDPLKGGFFGGKIFNNISVFNINNGDYNKNQSKFDLTNKDSFKFIDEKIKTFSDNSDTYGLLGKASLYGSPIGWVSKLFSTTGGVLTSMLADLKSEAYKGYVSGFQDVEKNYRNLHNNSPQNMEGMYIITTSYNRATSTGVFGNSGYYFYDRNTNGFLGMVNINY